MTARPGFTILEAALGGILLLGGAVSVTMVVKDSLASTSPSDPMSIGNAPLVEMMLRSQAEALSGDWLSPVPSANNAAIAPLRQYGWWYFTVYSSPSVAIGSNGANRLSPYDITVYATDSAAANLGASQTFAPAMIQGCYVLGWTRTWRLSNGTFPPAGL